MLAPQWKRPWKACGDARGLALDPTPQNIDLCRGRLTVAVEVVTAAVDWARQAGRGERNLAASALQLARESREFEMLLEHAVWFHAGLLEEHAARSGGAGAERCLPARV